MSAAGRKSSLPVWSAQQWLLVAFFVASGLLAWWQFQPAEQAPPGALERARLPDYVVTHFTAVEMDDRGKPSRRLVAEELRQYVDEDVSELTQPRMTLYQTDGEPWRARADSGIVMASGEEIQLHGGVELERNGNLATRSAHIATELLRIWHHRAYAETDRAVVATSDLDRLTATGMRLWYAEPLRAQFDGRAHIFLAPEQNEEP